MSRRNRPGIVLFVCVAVLAFSAAVYADESENVSQVGVIQGMPSAEMAHVTIEGDHAYAATSGEIFILDVSIPTAPRFVSRYVSPAGIEDISVHQGFIYIGEGEDGIRIVDATDPGSPAVAATSPVPAGVVFTSGERLFASYEDTLHIIDISDPGAPEYLGNYSADGRIRDMAITGDILAVALRTYGLTLLDVSDPGAVTVIAEAAPRTDRLKIEGDLLYAIGNVFGGAEFKVYDISEPAAMEETASYTFMQGYDEDLALVEFDLTASNAYISFTSEDPWRPTEYGLFSLSISNLERIDIVGTVNTLHGTCDVAINGDYLYLAATTGLRVYSLYRPAEPPCVAAFPPVQSGEITGLACFTDHLALSTNEGLFVANVADPSEVYGLPPSLEGGNYADIEIKWGYAYAAVNSPDSVEERHCLEKLDLSDPAQIAVEVGSPGSPANGTSVGVSGECVFALGFDGETAGVFALGNQDFGQPMAFHPVMEGNDIAASGNRAYVTISQPLTTRMLVLSYEDGAIVEEGDYVSAGNPQGVAVRGDIACIASGEAGIEVVDVGGPEPEPIGVYNTPGEALDVAAWFDNLYVADGSAGLRVLDAGEPGEIVETGYYSIEELSCERIELSYPYIYAVFSGGDLADQVLIFDVSEATAVGEPSEAAVPTGFEIVSISPNPFNSTAVIRLNLPSAALTVVTIHDVLGRKVADLGGEILPRGNHRLIFDAKGIAGGNYFVRAEWPESGHSMTKRICLLR